MDKSYNPNEVEDKWYKFWEENEFFEADPESRKEPFTIIMPPPNVTGVLHMGHALVSTLQDVQIRFKRMQGYESLWMPGTDHAGISTQTVVEKHLIKTTGKRRVDFPRDEFVEHIWKFKEENQEKILNQLRKIGCSCDWKKLRFTMDKTSSRAVKSMFKKLYDKGLIYRGDYLVNWDTLTETALSDDEVEYEEVDSYLWTVLYPLENQKGHIRIATTRPETMLGDVAIAVNPKDLRYKDLIGKNAILPFMNRKLPIIADPFVDLEFGTGAVKITPAHDPNDYEMGLRHNLEQINIMTPDGRINENGGSFCDLNMKEARSNIVKKLEEMGLLEKTEPHKHRVGKSYRSKAIIEPYLSKQWFVKMTAFKDELINIVKEKQVEMLPSYWENTYFHWIDNLRDWCISRQLWWGHQIPVWHNKKDPEKVICSEEMPEEVKKNPNDWEQDPDVLDTWFSSALWPFSTLGWPEDTKALSKFYPTSLLITGHDILFFWVARMIMMGSFALKKTPFHKTFLHGLIYGKSYWTEDAQGNIHYVETEDKKQYDLGKKVPKGVFSKWEKMSKSKKNVIDPLEICEEYGTDAMRLALCASATHARQIDLDRRRFDDYKNFANKLWNGARFVFMNLDESLFTEFSNGLDLDLLSLEDKWILSLLNRTIDKMNVYLENLNFDKAATCAYDFFWKEFCAYYVELCKPVLFDKEHPRRKNKQKILVIILSHVLCLMHPIAPFITEEIFLHLKKLFGKKDLKPAGMIDPYTEKTLQMIQAKALIIASYPQIIKKEDILEEVEERFAFIDKIIYQIRNIRGQMQIPIQEKTDLYISGLKDNPYFNLAKENMPAILALTKTNGIHFNDGIEEPKEFGASSVLENIKLFIPLPKHLQEKELLRLEKEHEKLMAQTENMEKRLADTSFTANAPAEVVDKMKHTLEENKRRLFEINQKLKSIIK